MVDMTKAAAPENPLGSGAGQLMLTAPFNVAGLARELSAAAPGIATAIKMPDSAEDAVSADNPGWLHWTGAATLAAVKKVVKDHDPQKVQAEAGRIAGSGVAQAVAGVREKIVAGGTLDAIETTTALAWLLGVGSAPSQTSG